MNTRIETSITSRRRYRKVRNSVTPTGNFRINDTRRSTWTLLSLAKAVKSSEQVPRSERNFRAPQKSRANPFATPREDDYFQGCLDGEALCLLRLFAN